MDTRKVTLIATVAVIALVAVGIGYAYTSTLTTTDNDVDVQAIKVVPYSNSSEKYTGSTADIQFDTSKTGTDSWMYGISMIDPAPTAIKTFTQADISTNYQKITDIDKIRVINEGDVQKTLTGLSITIKGNNDLTTQLSTGEYKTAVIKAILVDSAGKTCVLSTPAVDAANHNLVFSTDFSTAEEGFIKTVGDVSANPANHTEYTFHFIVEGEETCTHAAKLNESVFQIEYKATA